MRRFFKEFSFPGGIGSHCTPETPGSIHEGGELGYSVSHAFGAAFDNPDLIVAVVVGDGEAETGPLATSWHSTKFLNPIRDGAVLPILHLNGYKINNPTLLARISHEELEALFRGYGWTPHFVEGDDPATMHQAMAATLEQLRARDPPHPGGGAPHAASATRAALADDRAAQPEGLDRAEGGRRPQGRGLLARAPGAARRRARTTRRTSSCSRSGCAATGPRSCSTRTGGSSPSCAALAPHGRAPHERESARQRRPAAPALRLPDFRDYAVAGDEARHGRGREHAPARRVPARHHAAQSRQLPRLRPGRDHLEQARRRLRGERRRSGSPTYLPGGRRRRRARRRRPRDGDALRAHARGLARGLPADRAPRLLLDLRGLRARDRLDVQPARQVARHLRGALRGARRSRR